MRRETNQWVQISIHAIALTCGSITFMRQRYREMGDAPQFCLGECIFNKANGLVWHEGGHKKRGLCHTGRYIHRKPVNPARQLLVSAQGHCHKYRAKTLLLGVECCTCAFFQQAWCAEFSNGWQHEPPPQNIHPKPAL